MLALVKKEQPTKENVQFDKKRMNVALNSGVHSVPEGLTRAEKKALILSRC